MDFSLDPGTVWFIIRAFSVLFAVGLAYISFVSWRRQKRNIALFVCMAFLAYMLRDIVTLSEVVAPASINVLMVGLSDILDLLTLFLIYFAVLKE